MYSRWAARGEASRDQRVGAVVGVCVQMCLHDTRSDVAASAEPERRSVDADMMLGQAGVGNLTEGGAQKLL